MGLAKGKSRSSTSSSTRSVPYDLDLPENKTVAQLKYELSNRGIEFPDNAKKSQLIKLVKNYATRMTRPVQTPDKIRHDTLQEVNPEVDTSEQEPSHESRGQPDVSKHGDLHESISIMTSTMEKLVNRVSQLENNTNQQGTLIPQLVTTPLYPYFRTMLLVSIHWKRL